MRTFNHLLLIFPLVFVACGYPYRHRDAWEYRQPPEEKFIVELGTASQSLDAPSYYWNLLLEFNFPTPRFWMYAGHRSYLMADTIRSWRAKGKYEFQSQSMDRRISELAEYFENPSALISYTDAKTPTEISLLRLNLSGLGASPHVFLMEASKANDTSILVSTENYYRSVGALTRKLRKVTAEPNGLEKACVYVGYLAQEAEKRREPTDEYWELCQEQGSSTAQILDFLARKGI